MPKRINDLDLTHWKEYPEVLTSSLWLFEQRDTSGEHDGWYWGNFVPQVPRQLLWRFTRAGEWVLDPFLGSGTSLIECRRLGRHGLGVELNAATAAEATAHIERESNPRGINTVVVAGDSARLDFSALLRPYGVETVQLLILHPPYHDIIDFGSGPGDLSRAPNVPAFLDLFEQVLERTYPVLEPGRHLAVVIGDKYARGEWVPLGFYVMAALLERGCRLKGIIIKNIGETRAKRGQISLWRYRALRNGLVQFGHEYVLVFQKPSPHAPKRSGGSLFVRARRDARAPG